MLSKCSKTVIFKYHSITKFIYLYIYIYIYIIYIYNELIYENIYEIYEKHYCRLKVNKFIYKLYTNLYTYFIYKFFYIYTKIKKPKTRCVRVNIK